MQGFLRQILWSQTVWQRGLTTITIANSEDSINERQQADATLGIIDGTGSCFVCGHSGPTSKAREKSPFRKKSRLE